MTTSIATPPKLQFFTAGGVPLSGGKLYSYAAGTTTPLTTYTSSSGSVANTNPVILDSRGEADVWFSSATYKLKLTSSTDVEVWTVDNLNGPNQATLASLAASNGSSLVGYIQSGSGAVATTVQARLRQYVSVIDFGADTSGASSSSAAFTNANNLGNEVVITKGTYLLSTSVTFTVPVSIQYGAVITVPNGVTLTFNREMSAGVHQCFNCTGTGKVEFNSQFTSTGYPEWWGAVTNNGSDCLAAMLACVIACTVTQLQAADYFISSTLKIQIRTRTLRGMGFNYLGNDSASATRVIVLSGSLNCIQMGPDTEPPGGIDTFLTDVRVENLQATRSVVPVNGSDCAGILNQYTLYFSIDKVKAAENIIGFHYGGTVSGYTTNCRSFRSTTGSGGGADKYYGFYVDGIGYDIGAAGGNASIYFNDCNSSAAGTDANFTLPTNSIGFFLQDDFTDCYITNCELNATAYGIYVSGTGSATQAYGNNDLLITAPVIDVFMVAGIRFDQISKYGSISINGGYCAPASNVTAALIGLTPIAGLYFTDSLGQISISDFQIIGNSSTTCTGITAITAQNIESRTQIIDCQTTPISLSSVTNSRFLDHISNYGNVTSAAVELIANNARNYFQVFAVGKASAFSLGYQGSGTTNTYNELNCTGLDPAAIASGSANKLTWNGTQITTTGAISTGTTNLAAGVMA